MSDLSHSRVSAAASATTWMPPRVFADVAAAREVPDGAALVGGLRRLGYTDFRPGQKSAIEALLRHGSLLLVAPTGGGKSLCYQLPALLLPGTTLVISPLIALMHDQVLALERRGVDATFIASTLDADEVRRRMHKLRQGAYKVVYAAPERLQFEGFRALLGELRCPLIAVDEAHCISEWGHDFRPEYMKIGELLPLCPNACVLACTATATPVVRDEIMARLGLGPETPQIVQGFARPNLALRAVEVSGPKARQAQTDALLREALQRPGAGCGTAIVYGPTRKSCEAEAERLQHVGWRAGAYHAGMDGPSRQRVQEIFVAGDLEVIVATNAFGMGIDRADVRAVVHLAPPGSIEAYYQEVGRAGRDGQDAFGLMCTQPADMPMRRRMLERPGPEGAPPSPAVVEHKWGLFLELMRWAEGGTCRHDAILRYFGDEHETLAGCGRCDVCILLADGGRTNDDHDVQPTVQKALSAVARIHGRLGLGAAVALLRGDDDARLAGRGLDRVRTFGQLRGADAAWVTALLRRCVTAGWVDFVGDTRPCVVLTRQGVAVMKGETSPRILLPPRQRTPTTGRLKLGARATAGARRQGAIGGVSALAELDSAAAGLFESLRRLRLELAKVSEVPPYVVASDRSLRDIATLRPRSLEALQAAHGIGEAKAKRYGRAFLAVIAAAAE